jgi:hypothetical protein
MAINDFPSRAPRGTRATWCHAATPGTTVEAGECTALPSWRPRSENASDATRRCGASSSGVVDALSSLAWGDPFAPPSRCCLRGVHSPRRRSSCWALGLLGPSPSNAFALPVPSFPPRPTDRFVGRPRRQGNGGRSRGALPASRRSRRALLPEFGRGTRAAVLRGRFRSPPRFQQRARPRPTTHDE